MSYGGPINPKGISCRRNKPLRKRATQSCVGNCCQTHRLHNLFWGVPTLTDALYTQRSSHAGGHPKPFGKKANSKLCGISLETLKAAQAILGGPKPCWTPDHKGFLIDVSILPKFLATHLSKSCIISKTCTWRRMNTKCVVFYGCNKGKECRNPHNWII